MIAEKYKMLTIALAAILAFILVSGALFGYFNRHYIAQWYRKVSNDAVAVSPFLEQRVQAFEVTPAVPPGKDLLVFVGDSLIETFPWDEHFADRGDLQVVNRGIYGDTLDGLAGRFDVSFLVERSPTIVLMIGANDITADPRCSEPFVAAYDALLARLLRAGVPGERVYVNGLLPVRREDKSNDAISACNAAIRQRAAHYGMHYIDLHAHFANESGELQPDLSLEDGLHLNAEGYRLWLGLLRERLAAGGDGRERA